MQATVLKPARVCAWCGKGLSREFVESGEPQSHGICVPCRDKMMREHKLEGTIYPKPVWPMLFFLTFAFWAAVIIVWLIGGFGK